MRDEPGADKVAALLAKAEERDQPLHMTEINYTEVQYVIRRKDGEAAWRVVAGELAVLPIEFHPVDRRLADQAADFKTRHKLSLADAFAAALAKLRNAELVTGDREFKALEGEIKISWLN
ncbi:MAG: PIN domain-containing protein [Verrucomicrobiae bacterium]|nr:PIN domain-containing protein [Verrucomicrobiae bacterium]